MFGTSSLSEPINVLI